MDKYLLKRLQAERDSFSKRQKLIADYIINNYDKAAFMTAAKLGKTVNVSESTVVRFAAELGFEGFPQMQKVLQDIVLSKLTAVQRIEVASDRMDKNNVLNMVLRSHVDNILHTLEQTDRNEFNAVVDTVLGARNIYIIGVRSSSALANFLGFYLNLIFPSVHIVSTISMSEMFEQIFRISEDDVFIGISFPRYSQRTIRAMRFALAKNAKVVAITDSFNSPLCDCASYKLTAKSDMISFVDSLVAPLSLINALIVAVSMRKKEEISEVFKELEKIWDEYNVYEKFDNE
jgi:DNA-binding MurR/RpiR family transcriptional regulator